MVDLRLLRLRGHIIERGRVCPVRPFRPARSVSGAGQEMLFARVVQPQEALTVKILVLVVAGQIICIVDAVGKGVGLSRGRPLDSPTSRDRRAGFPASPRVPQADLR
jgi:hypothetical protein